jgi:hypothetical protein
MSGTATDVEGGFAKDFTPDSSTKSNSGSGASNALVNAETSINTGTASLSTAFLSSGMPVAFKVRALICLFLWCNLN